MAHLVKVLATKPEDMIFLIPRTQLVRWRMYSYKWSSDSHTCAMGMFAPAHSTGGGGGGGGGGGVGVGWGWGV